MQSHVLVDESVGSMWQVNLPQGLREGEEEGPESEEAKHGSDAPDGR